jgi:fructokinase
MLIGIDWGGTKIEGIAMTPDGAELARLRVDTPRHDYPACIARIVQMIADLEAETGQQGSIGIGIPGSLEPVSRLGKGASSTWLLGQPVEAAKTTLKPAPSALKTTPTALPRPRPSMARGRASTWSLR